MMELFDDRSTTLFYIAIITTTAVVAVAGIGVGRAFQYWYFDNMKPPASDRVQDLIIAMR